MISNQRIQDIIGLLLLTGTLLSGVMVLIGGICYLLQSGQQPLELTLFENAPIATSFKHVWHEALSFSSLGLVQLGLLSLVMTQVLRVALLCWFYSAIRDYKFMFISFFILGILIYSSFLR
jgi:uncharacterized membrane protein